MPDYSSQLEALQRELDSHGLFGEIYDIRFGIPEGFRFKQTIGGGSRYGYDQGEGAKAFVLRKTSPETFQQPLTFPVPRVTYAIHGVDGIEMGGRRFNLYADLERRDIALSVNPFSSQKAKQLLGAVEERVKSIAGNLSYTFSETGD